MCLCVHPFNKDVYQAINFTFPLDDFGKVLCLSANVLQQNSKACSREDYIPQLIH